MPDSPPISPDAQAVLDASLEAFYLQDDLDSRLVPHVVAAALRAAAKHAPLAAADPYDVLIGLADEIDSLSPHFSHADHHQTRKAAMTTPDTPTPHRATEKQWRETELHAYGPVASCLIELRDTLSLTREALAALSRRVGALERGAVAFDGIGAAAWLEREAGR